MKSIYKIIIFLTLLLEARFLYLFNIPSFISKYNTYHTKILIFLLIFCGIFIMLVFKHYKYIKRKVVFNKFVILFLLLVLSEIFISYVNYSEYSQTFIDLIWVCYFYFIICLYYIIVYLGVRFNDYSYKKVIIIFSLILSIIFIIQAYIYNLGGTLMLKISEIANIGIESRLGRIRLTYPSTLISFACVLSFSEIFNRDTKKKTLNILNLVCSLIYLIYVCQTRALIVYVIFSMLIVFIFVNRKSAKKIILMIITLVIAVNVFINLNITKEYINSFTDSKNSISNIARSGAIDYFIDRGNENLIFGSGFINSSANSETFYISRGSYGMFSTTDVGIFGYYSIFGIAGLVLYLYLILKMLTIIWTLIKSKKIDYCVEIIGIFIFFISTSLTLIVTDSQRIILFPIILALFNNKYYLEIVKEEG